MKNKGIKTHLNKGLLCSVVACQRIAFCKGWCRAHYARVYTKGRLDLPVRPSTKDKLLAGLKRVGECWIWTGVVSKSGYGAMYRSGEQIPSGTHRVAFEVFCGPIPAGVGVLHKCDVKTCCNPDHLFLGTALDNAQDASRKNRTAFGNRQPRAKLNPSLVRRIRELKGRIPQSKIAKEVGCSQSNIATVLSKKTWARVP